MEWDTSTCGSSACGNGTVDFGEECESDDVIQCTDMGYSGGWASCDSCQWDTSTCTLDDCGNGWIDDGEACEPDDSIACAEIGYKDGTAYCYSDCSGWDTNGCASTKCGDGVVDWPESCELGQTANCDDINGSQVQLGTATCSSSCQWNMSGCQDPYAALVLKSSGCSGCVGTYSLNYSLLTVNWHDIVVKNEGNYGGALQIRIILVPLASISYNDTCKKDHYSSGIKYIEWPGPNNYDSIGPGEEKIYGPFDIRMITNEYYYVDPGKYRWFVKVVPDSVIGEKGGDCNNFQSTAEVFEITP